MFGDKPHELPHRVAFILIPEFTLMPFTAAVEPLRLANMQSGHQLYQWSTHASSGDEITSSCNLVSKIDGDLDDIPFRSDVLVCGGRDIHKHVDQACVNWLRKASRKGTNIGALCTGTHILAKAGVLDGYKCTIHWNNISGFVETFPALEVTGHLFDIDRDRFTCAGGTASLDMMLALVGHQHGQELAASVAEAILHTPIRHHSENQRMSLPARIGARHPRLVSIIEQMENNLEEPYSPSYLAKQAGLSARQLERLFRRYLDRSPKRYYLELRLKKARSLLLQTDMSVINVALACGFSSPSHFSKCYRAFYNRTPYRERGVPSLD